MFAPRGDPFGSWPRFHRVLYSARFGRNAYRRRFVDSSNGLFGDMSIGKRDHTNYEREWVVERLAAHRLDVVRTNGANLFWRWFQIPALLLGRRLGRPFEHLVDLDGKLFRSANLFLTAEKRNEPQGDGSAHAVFRAPSP